MKKTYINFLLIGSLLTSCSFAPEYQQPEDMTAPYWQNEEQKEMANDQVKLASNIAWKDFFLSPELQNVIQLALDNNRDLKNAILNVQRSKATYSIAEVALYPTLDANGSIDYEGDYRGNESHTYNVNLATTYYELDFFGRIRNMSDAALNSYLATDEAQKNVAIALISQSAISYLKLISDQENLQLAKETLTAQEQSYELIEKGYNYGVATKLDLSQVKIAVETARTDSIKFKRFVQQDKNALVALLGVTSIDEITLNKKLSEVAMIQELPVGLPSQVLLNRPDIKQAEFVLRGAGANIGSARANFYPKISLTGQLGYASASLSDLFDGGVSGLWKFAPSITIPIFDAGQNKANLKIAEIDQKIAINNYESAVQNAFKEVADQLAGKETLTNQLKAQSMLVDASQEAYDISSTRYNQGIDSFLNVLDAQRSLFGSQQSLIETNRQKLANQVSLYKVLGGGLAGVDLTTIKTTNMPVNGRALEGVENK
ncbi:MAG: efflux transporter outer membrane subunit [Desulfotalea sp.]